MAELDKLTTDAAIGVGTMFAGPVISSAVTKSCQLIDKGVDFLSKHKQALRKALCAAGIIATCAGDKYNLSDLDQLVSDPKILQRIKEYIKNSQKQTTHSPRK